jgi:hypothetical protein
LCRKDEKKAEKREGTKKGGEGMVRRKEGEEGMEGRGV